MVPQSSAHRSMSRQNPKPVPLPVSTTPLYLEQRVLAMYPGIAFCFTSSSRTKLARHEPHDPEAVIRGNPAEWEHSDC